MNNTKKNSIDICRSMCDIMWPCVCILGNNVCGDVGVVRVCGVEGDVVMCPDLLDCLFFTVSF